ncbi:MAG: glycosyltransferase [Nanoarchaeota archaeon]
MNPKMISLILCAHNEEKTIYNILHDIKREFKYFPTKYELIICLSACTDNTQNEVKRALQYLNLKARVLNTPRGKIISQWKALSCVDQKSASLIFLDSDIRLDNLSLRYLVEESQKYPSLKMVYARGIPLTNKKLIYNIMNVRTLNPSYVRARKNVEEFHPYTKDKKKKIFATGGIYLLKKGVYDVDPKAVGDDSYLTHSIYHRFGPGSIKESEQSVFFYQPVQTFGSWIAKWRRIWGDLGNLYETHPEFKYLRPYMSLKVDYIKLLNERRLGLALSFFIERSWHIFGKPLVSFSVRRNNNPAWKTLSDTKIILHEKNIV